VSLLDMLKFNGSSFSGAIVEIASFKLVLENHPQGRGAAFTANGIVDVKEAVIFMRGLSVDICSESIVRYCDDILHIFDRLADFQSSNRKLVDKTRIEFDDFDIANLRSFFSGLVTIINSELSSRIFTPIAVKHAAFLENGCFGEDVENSFPSATVDIDEAGKCRALGRWTASVMHLMRVLEVGLKVLAAHCDVIHADNWNKTLNEMEASIRSVKKSVDGIEAEQWAAEAGTHLRFIKGAYRNHAMHPMKRYDEEQAVYIFDSARAFMRHLATRLSE